MYQIEKEVTQGCVQEVYSVREAEGMNKGNKNQGMKAPQDKL
jgi:hypothetical protein